MEAKMLVPEVCSKCKRFFDLKYDLALREDGGLKMNEPLCWNCRVISLFLRELQEKSACEAEEFFEEEVLGV